MNDEPKKIGGIPRDPKNRAPYAVLHDLLERWSFHPKKSPQRCFACQQKLANHQYEELFFLVKQVAWANGFLETSATV